MLEGGTRSLFTHVRLHFPPHMSFSRTLPFREYGKRSRALHEGDKREREEVWLAALSAIGYSTPFLLLFLLAGAKFFREGSVSFRRLLREAEMELLPFLLFVDVDGQLKCGEEENTSHSARVNPRQRAKGEEEGEQIQFVPSSESRRGGGGIEGEDPPPLQLR